MTDFDQVLAHIGAQIEEIKKRIRSSRDRAGLPSIDVNNHHGERKAEGSVQSLQPGTENRQDEPVRKS
jgi:hypothetical protein